MDKISPNTVLEVNTFSFNKHDNGGEQLILTTTFFANGDPGAGGVFTNHELTLNSYYNSASFTLCGISINPELLRKLANELDQKMNSAKSKVEW